MEDIDLKKYVAEAKHTSMLFMRFMGNAESWPVLVKWPDVVDNLVKGDKEALLCDLSLLIYSPLQSIALGLLSQIPEEERDLFKKEITEAVVVAKNDVFNSKSRLISICNIQINKLRSSKGKQFVLLGELEYDRNHGRWPKS